MHNQPKKPKPRKKPIKIKPEDKPLTGKQEAFCVWLVSGAVNFNAVEAVRRAGYRGSDATLRSIASQNLTKPNIKARIEKLKAKALSGADVTIEKTLRNLVVIGEKALEAGKYSAAAKCEELKGKYLKMWTERIEHVMDIDDMSQDELVSLLLEVTEKGGVDLSKLIAGNGSGDSGMPDPARNQKPH